MTPRLYGYWRSSASWRVRWAFNVKQVTYDYVPVNILKQEHKAPEHRARSPLGALPVLEIKLGLFLSESLAMIEWIDESHPLSGPALYPTALLDRAFVRSFCEIINSGTGPLQTPRAQNRHSSDAAAKTAWAKDFIVEGLDAYDKTTKSWRGQFSFRDQLSAADLCLIPQIYNAKRYGIDVEREFPALAQIYAACLKTEACSAASPERQPDAVIS